MDISYLYIAYAVPFLVAAGYLLWAWWRDADEEAAPAEERQERPQISLPQVYRG